MSKEKHELSLEKQAELEKSRTISDAQLLEDEEIGLGPGETIEKGEKRLEVTERQIAKARHEMLRSLGRNAMRNKNLARIGLESTEGLPQYDLLSSMPEGMREIEGRAICCVLESALGSDSDAEVGEFSNKELINKVLEAFYKAHPDLNNPEKPFLLEGDFRTVVVRGYKMEYLP